MQLQFRIDDTNYVTVSFQLQKSGNSGFTDGPEVIAATIADSKLSDITNDQLFDLAAAVLEHFEQPQASSGTSPDWRSEFLEATKY